MNSALRNLGSALTPNVPHNSPAQPARATTPQPSKPAAEGVFMTIALAELSEAWPEALRLEIAQLSLTDAKVALPAESIEAAMKRGKVAFPWKTVRSWIRPAPLPTVSVHDGAVLELPLKAIMPHFMTRQKAAKSQQKASMDETIPNLFFGFPQPDAPQPDAPQPAAPQLHAPQPRSVVPEQNGNASTARVNPEITPTDTNFYVWDDTADAPKEGETEFKRKSTGTESTTRCATPNEVVARAAALDRVAGALVALPDGLMVAGKLSPDLNGDTLAAFLPHIFGKVSQCTKELRMGELNNLNFTVGNVPWKIFRVNAIFFAAFGRIGEPLPTAQLAVLAAELDHKKQ
jgi:predicted regulator of Ras-like GTPase activity (Roadblock/LC7/MglB family)